MFFRSPSLDSLRREAEIYYETPAYREACDFLGDVLGPIEGKTIAFDFEGVLVNVDELNKFPRCERLRRPLAREAIEILRRRNRVLIWSAAGSGFITLAIKTSGLSVGDLEVVDRNIAAARVLDAHILSDDDIELAHRVDTYDDDGYDYFANGILERINVALGKLKIPSILGVDVLIDDCTDRHGEACRAVGRPDDCTKLLAVSAFAPYSSLELRGHHFDRGILDASLSLSRYFDIEPPPVPDILQAAVLPSPLPPTKKSWLDGLRRLRDFFQKML